MSEEDKYSVNVNAVDLLHTAVVKTVEENCQKQLDTLINQLEEAGERGDLTDEDIRSMLRYKVKSKIFWKSLIEVNFRQAIGLAKFMRRDQVAESLKELLDDPVMINAIKDDAIVRYG